MEASIRAVPPRRGPWGVLLSVCCKAFSALRVFIVSQINSLVPNSKNADTNRQEKEEEVERRGEEERDIYVNESLREPMDGSTEHRTGREAQELQLSFRNSNEN